VLAGLPAEVATHSSVHKTFERFGGARLAVVGGGQSALEVSALAAEAGADVETIVRRDSLHFLRGERLYTNSGVMRRVLYPPLGVGPPGLNWLMGLTSIYRRLPARLRTPLAYRAIRPAGAAWLRPRLEPVRITLGRNVVAAESDGSAVRLRLDSGEQRSVDHVIVATGYRVDIRGYEFLDPGLRADIRTTNGFPSLSAAFECSVSGVHFVGAPAAASAGPGMRFVSHSGSAAEAITASIAGRGSRGRAR
jgi:thioredoxin reductase